MPLVVSWGTIVLIIATYTPVFQWISLPFAWLLELVKIPEAYKVAPMTAAKINFCQQTAGPPYMLQVFLPIQAARQRARKSTETLECMSQLLEQ